jgi:hypothetical protein
MPTTPHRRLGECFLAAVAYVLTTWACLWLLRHPLADAALWLRAATSLLPILPMLLAVRAVVRLILAGDELQRRIDLEAIAASSLLVGLGALTLNLLIRAEVLEISSRQATLWVLPALWVGYALARIWAARRYR